MCHLASHSYVIIEPMYPQEINKTVMSVPSCCVLPEDMISKLAMQGKPVALSLGATTLGIRAALIVGRPRRPTR